MEQQSMVKGLYGFALDEWFNNIFPFWTEKVKDPDSGGFHGAFLESGTPNPDAPRVLILNARLLWTYSAAYRIFGHAEFLENAWYVYRYFMKHFWDKKYGGAYYSVNPDGSPCQDFKLVYGQAFAIYGLSEFFRASQHEPAKKDAVSLYGLLEKVARDKTHDGYYECFSRDWSERADKQYTMAGTCTKSMNTHLHMIEAYTSLLRIHDTPQMREDTRNLYRLMTQKILNRASGHYYMYLSDDWNPSGLAESYGHDIEGSWLMNECAHVLGDPDLIRESEEISVEMANACQNAIMMDGSMLEEGMPDGSFHGEARSWWVQAENVVGMLNAWQANKDSHHLENAYRQARFIRQYVSDHDKGEWFGYLEGIQYNKRYLSKVSGWKCPYHNARMCFEIIERYPDLQASAARATAISL